MTQQCAADAGLDITADAGLDITADAVLDITADAVLDITSETCPMTYVRTRLALDRLQSGQVLHVRLRGADPAASVPRAAVQQGHAVLSQQTGADGVTVLLLRRA